MQIDLPYPSSQRRGIKYEASSYKVEYSTPIYENPIASDDQVFGLTSSYAFEVYFYLLR